MIKLASLVLLLITVGVGCAKPFQANAFEGPDQPDSQVARLQLDPEIRLVSVDGKPVSGIPSEWDSNKGETYRPRIVRLLPGTHRILAGINPNTAQGNPGPMGPAVGGGWSVGVGVTMSKHYPGSREDEQIEFTAEPGKKYILRLENPLDMFTKQEKWSLLVYDPDSPEFKKQLARSHGRIPHEFPPAKK